MSSLADYVLFHFRRLYHLPSPLEVSYGVDHQSRIQITSTASTFFERQQPKPVQVVWKEWQGHPLPLFFDENTDQPWFSQNAQGHVVVHYDLVASAFYLLSSWQEFYGPERDPFGRYPYKASQQARHRFITKPLVNYYLEILKEAVERAYGQEILPRLWNGKPFAACLTHDIDYCQSAWKVAGKPALQKGNLGLFFRLAQQKFTGEDAWFNLPQVEAELAKLSAKGTFFFLPEAAPYEGHPNADYEVTSPKIRQELLRLSAAGHEIALHGSHGTGTQARRLQAEREKLPPPIQGNRFHYLRFDPVKTPHLLQELGFTYDSTLGFSEHYGFRNSFCHPFRLFDFKSRQMSTVWEMPLNLMDVTLNHPRYLQLTPSEVMPAITPMLEEIIRFHGVFTLLWHNENFTPYGMAGGLQLFQDITQFLKNRQANFFTISEALKQLD
ncbi:polysaccharide deacetylase family protein [Rufibacter psychrotolerans]|uniref:polysaccharide deacetylase family protein n=1 Tax=Rufibacter psychrotolerans TaxID=2812556 RepID=UPI001966E418|nr:polysaccharide deacetylase family protein [Rufibacter sp. SYSU D00308]